MQELMIRARIVATELADRARERATEEKGQTAAEYLGIIVLVGLIFTAIFALNLDQTIADTIKKVVDFIAGKFSG